MKCSLLRIKDLSSIVLLLCDSFMLGSEISPGSIPIEHLDGNMLQVKARRHHNLIEMQGIFKSWRLAVFSIWECLDIHSTWVSFQNFWNLGISAWKKNKNYKEEKDAQFYYTKLKEFLGLWFLVMWPNWYALISLLRMCPKVILILKYPCNLRNVRLIIERQKENTKFPIGNLPIQCLPANSTNVWPFIYFFNVINLSATWKDD